MRSARHPARALTLLAGLACADVGRESERTRVEQQGSTISASRRPIALSLPAFALRGREMRSVLEVPPAEMRRALANTYRVAPDRRFLGAIAEVHRLVTGRSLDSVTATFGEGGWTIDYAGERVGDLPHLPSFEQGQALLATWTSRLLQRFPLDSTRALDVNDLTRARDLVSRPRPLELMAGLKLVDAGWSRARRREWLVPAANGLALLAMQVPRFEVVGDPIAARALAVTSIARAAGHADSVARATVMLAGYMGYTVEATKLGARLPASDPVRLFTKRDTAALRGDPRSLSGFLYLAELARRGGDDEWTAWMEMASSKSEEDDHDHEQLFDTSAVTSGIVGRGLDFDDFDVDRMIADELPKELRAELEALTQGRERVDASHRAFSRADSTDWSDVLREGGASAKRLTWFEAELGAATAQTRGPFLDPALTGAYFRAQLHHAFERRCIYLVDGPPPIAEALAFAKGFAGSPEGLWRETVRWCLQHALVASDQPAGAQSLRTLREVAALSKPALTRVLGDLAQEVNFKSVLEFEIARATFARLDSRPADLFHAGYVARDLLYDFPLAEPFYERLVALAADDYEHLAVWHAFHAGDLRSLERIAADTLVSSETRFVALERLLERGADSARVHARFRQLINERGSPWDIRSEYIRRVLEPAGRFEDAAVVAQEWLDRVGRPYDSYVSAVTALARQYQWLGRPLKASETIGRVRKTDRLGVIQRWALIALDLGDTTVADSLARSIVDEYRDSPSSRITLAQIGWAMGDYTRAARVVVDSIRPLDGSDWRETVAPTFVRFFRQRSTGEAVRALGTLASAGGDVLELARIQRRAAKDGHYDLAAALSDELSRHGDPRVFYPETYGYLRVARGEEAAFKWIATRWPPPQTSPYVIGDAYRVRMFDLLWTLTTKPDESRDGSFLWLMRALGELQQPKPRPDRRRALLQHYRGTGGGPYDIAGRFLLGLEPEEKMVALATSPKRRVEYSYYIGIKALSEGRYREASDWLRVTAETGQTRDGEFVWAKELLADWVETGKTLPEAAKEIMSRKSR